MSTFVFEQTPKWTMGICASDKVWCSVSTYCGRHIQKADLSRFVCPWCVFHVCWKDKHSCTLMTLKCFRDSECMCMCVCVCVYFFLLLTTSVKSLLELLSLYTTTLYANPTLLQQNSLPSRIFLYLCVRECACVHVRQYLCKPNWIWDLKVRTHLESLNILAHPQFLTCI